MVLYLVALTFNCPRHFNGFLGAYLARIQGLQTLFRIQESLREGRMPSGELLDALLIGVAGLVLLTPGFFNRHNRFYPPRSKQQKCNQILAATPD